MPVKRNTPPTVDLHAALAPDVLDPWLEERFARHRARKDELLASFGRMPHEIGDDETNKKAMNLEKMLRAAVKDTTETHHAIKEPVLLATREIDGRNRLICQPMLDAAVAIATKRATYLAEQDRKEREAARVEAERLQAEAEALIDQAVESVKALEQAETIGEQLAEVEAALEAKPAQIRTALGVTSRLIYEWVYQGVDDLTQVPHHYLMVNEAVVKAAIRTGTTSIPGLCIVKIAKAPVR